MTCLAPEKAWIPPSLRSASHQDDDLEGFESNEDNVGRAVDIGGFKTLFHKCMHITSEQELTISKI